MGEIDLNSVLHTARNLLSRSLNSRGHLKLTVMSVEQGKVGSLDRLIFFHTVAIIYFQLLTAVCSLVKYSFQLFLFPLFCCLLLSEAVAYFPKFLYFMN